MADRELTPDGGEESGHRTCPLTHGPTCGLTPDCLDSRQLDRVLDALSDRRQRRVLYHLWTVDGTVIERLSLAEAVQAAEAAHGEESSPTDDVVRDLHHRVLPALQRAGFLTYDTRQGTVRYDAPSEFEELVAHTRYQEKDEAV